MDFKIRENRGESQGRKALVRERAEYFQLMDQGFSSREACQIVGINRRTGKRWRNGRQATGNTRGAPPVRRPGLPEGPSRYLREADRIHIADRLREKASVR
ncbi:helix-turn-helix domain-containing protein, partial [Streptomyces sp. SID8361]|nr:helix-turn-helix domain-containing protein [Streptomyces sp. SID8361]